MQLMTAAQVFDGGTSATAAVGVIFAATPFIESWAPSERAKALGVPISVPLANLEPARCSLTYGV